MDARKSSRGSTDLRGSTQPGFRPSALCEALRLLRYRTHLTRQGLADLTGVAAGLIANYENDVSVPPAPELRRLIRTFADQLDRDRRELWDDLGTLLDEQDAGDRP
jgi:transcriptional regulator with XRE-family HTH domain